MRLIDKNKLTKEICGVSCEKCVYYKSKGCIAFDSDKKDGILTAIKNQPEVDAIQVVRCKDFKFYKYDLCEIWSEEPDVISSGYNMETDPDDFCSRGERKKMDGDEET